MTTTNRRLLLTGASIAALGIASPALADPWYPADAPHNDVADGFYTGEVNAPAALNDEIVICDLADPDPCFYGEVDHGGNAFVVSAFPVVGQAVLNPAAAVDIAIVNDQYDTAEI